MSTNTTERPRSTLPRLPALWTLRLLGRFPLSWLHGIAHLVGWFLAVIPNKHRRNALINIQLCFPELGASAQRRLRDEALIELCKTFLELGKLWFAPLSEVLELIRETDGCEQLVTRPGEGLVVLSPHLGAWEMAGLYLSTRGKTTSMYRPQLYIDREIRMARERAGAQLVPADAGGVKQMYRALSQGEIVGILPDQVPKGGKAAVFAPFFHQPAYTMLLVNRLARKTGARVVFLFAERLPESRGFRMRCLPADPAIADADEVAGAAALNAGVAASIRCCPSQYFWIYKRFRKNPHHSNVKCYTGPK